MNVVSALFLLLAAHVQTQTPPPRMVASDSQPNDIVVEGYRLRKAPDSRVQPPALVSTVANRRKYEYSERIAKCAARNRLNTLARFRAVVDGEFNTARHRYAQHRLVRAYITCSESPTLLTFSSPPQSAADAGVDLRRALEGDFQTAGITPDPFPLGWSIYDRGAFTIEALRRFAPDLQLTRRDTTDAAVQARFNARETSRNRFRLPADYRYFEIAVCMVRVEPQLAVRLALSVGPARLGDVQEALIDRARVCVGGAKRVQVDPTQFRIYIADAVYRWAVAAKGVDSLIPSA